MSITTTYTNDHDQLTFLEQLKSTAFWLVTYAYYRCSLYWFFYAVVFIFRVLLEVFCLAFSARFDFIFHLYILKYLKPISFSNSMKSMYTAIGMYTLFSIFAKFNLYISVMSITKLKVKTCNLHKSLQLTFRVMLTLAVIIVCSVKPTKSAHFPQQYLHQIWKLKSYTYLRNVEYVRFSIHIEASYLYMLYISTE